MKNERQKQDLATADPVSGEFKRKRKATYLITSLIQRCVNSLRFSPFHVTSTEIVLIFVRSKIGLLVFTSLRVGT